MPSLVPRIASRSHSAPILRLTCVLQAVFLSILFHATGGIDEFLLAGKERMAIGANLHMNVTARGACLNHMAASTSDCCRLICWMNSCLHRFLSIGDFYTIRVKLLQLPPRRSVARVNRRSLTNQTITLPNSTKPNKLDTKQSPVGVIFSASQAKADLCR